LVDWIALLIADSIQIPKYAACVITHPKSLLPLWGSFQYGIGTWHFVNLSRIFTSLLRRGAGGEVFGCGWGEFF